MCSSDLAVVSALADRIAVMYAGRIVEEGEAQAVLARPLHRYTAGLLGSIPSQTLPGERLRAIAGFTPSLGNLPAGCPFKPRCGHADSACESRPLLAEKLPGRRVACIHPVEATIGTHA